MATNTVLFYISTEVITTYILQVSSCANGSLLVLVAQGPNMGDLDPVMSGYSGMQKTSNTAPDWASVVIIDSHRILQVFQKILPGTGRPQRLLSLMCLAGPDQTWNSCCF